MSKWEMVRLGDVASYLNGYPFKPSEWSEDGLPIIRIQDLTGNSYETNRYSGSYNKKYEVNYGDILISWSASLGVYEWTGEKALLNQHIFKVIFNKMIVDKRYFIFTLSHLLNSMSNQTHGSTMKHITKPRFDNTPFPLPPLAEQQKIAAELDKISGLIAKRKSQIEKLDLLVKAKFVEMFFSGNFPIIKTEDVCQFITKGTTPKADEIFEHYTDELIPYLKVYNLSFDGKLLFNENPQFISVKTHNKTLSRSKVYPNDILMNIVGPPLGKFSLVPHNFNEYNINQAIAIFRVKDTINAHYLLYALMQPSTLRPFIDSAVGIRQQNLSLQQCRTLELPLPPLSLQNQFADFAQKVELTKSTMQKCLAGLETLYKARMQEYFE